MATDAKKLQPIIIKRVKKSDHGVHGGAWKIAYADFVTAMMAFFLLMWLLSTSSEDTLKGLSEYFNPPTRLSLSGGQSFGASSVVMPGGGADLTRTAGQTMQADSDNPRRRRDAFELKRAAVAQQDAKRLSELSAKVSAIISNNSRLRRFSDQIRLEMTPDGLQIQIIDEQGRPMFTSGSPSVQPYMREILREIGAALNSVDNRISLDGHTDRTPYAGGSGGYSNWELSADRANASRRELVAAGMPESKLVRITGLADSNLLLPESPTSPANRRISILVLTREAEERILGEGRVPVLAPDAPSTPPAPASTSPVPSAQ